MKSVIRHITPKIIQAMMYPVKRPRIQPGIGSIPNGIGLGVPSLTHRSKSPSRHPPLSELIQLEADRETIKRNTADKHSKNASTFIGLGWETVVIVVDIVEVYLEIYISSKRLCLQLFILKPL